MRVQVTIPLSLLPFVAWKLKRMKKQERKERKRKKRKAHSVLPLDGAA